MRRKEKEISASDEIDSIIAMSDVCRIAFADGNIPYIVTMNFGYSGSERKIYFHCAPAGRKLEMLQKNNYVCFEFDTGHQLYIGPRGCDWGMKFSSVVGYGRLSVITDNEGRKRGLECIMKQYGGTPEMTFDEKILGRTTILELKIEDITGKKS